MVKYSFPFITVMITIVECINAVTYVEPDTELHYFW